MPQIFCDRSTADEVLEGTNLAGKRALVTGVSSGIGLETARALVAHGCDVVGAVRELKNAESATEAIKALADSGVGSFELVECDLASLASVRLCTKRLVDEGKPIHFVVANAGVMYLPQGKSEDGFEMHFATNHLGHFLLVNRLKPLMQGGCRVVIVSSSGHRWSDVSLDDPNFEHTPYDRWVAYGRTKTANALMAVEMDRRFKSLGIRAASVHPGIVDTPMMRPIPRDELQMKADSICASNKDTGKGTIEFKTLSQGAATSVWAAVVADGDTVGGWFCEDCHVAKIDDSPSAVEGVRSYAVDAKHGLELWEKSEEMVQEVFQ